MKKKYIIIKINEYTDETTYYGNLNKFYFNSFNAILYSEEEDALKELEIIIQEYSEGVMFYIQQVYTK